jgi:ABC-type glycerol-3-phosphate transport system substrate-binding protein
MKKKLSRREFLKGMAAAGFAVTATGSASKVMASNPYRDKLRTVNFQTTKTLTLTTIPGTAANILNFMADNFKADNPDVEIVVNLQPDEETYKSSFPQIAISSDRPDVAWYWVDGRQYRDLTDIGAFEPLDDLWAEMDLENVYPQAIVDRYTSEDGSYYSGNLEFGWYPQVYYNRRIFDELGIAEPANGAFYESLDEWLVVIETLREAGIQPVSIGGNSSAAWIVGHTVDTLLQRMIPEPLYSDMLVNYAPGSEPLINYDGPEWAEVMEMLQQWHETGVFADGYLSRGYPEGRALFVQEEAAMYQDGSWAPSAGILYAEAPDLDFGWMLYPRIREEIDPKFLVYAGAGIMIPKDPSDLGLAKEFVRHTLSQEQHVQMMENQIAFSPRTDIPEEVIAMTGEHVADMQPKLVEVGTTTGWDDPIPADLAQRAHVLYGEMLTGSIDPADVGAQLERVVARSRR